jgi:hypothetical protein
MYAYYILHTTSKLPCSEISQIVPQYMCTGGISRPYLGGLGLGVDMGGRGGEKTGRRGGRMP